MSRARATAVALALMGGLSMMGTCRPVPSSDPSSVPSTAVDGSKRISDPPSLRGWHYSVEVAESLERADVEVCFDGPPPQRLIPGLKIAAGYASDVLAQGQPLPRAGRAYDLSTLGPDACVTYWIDFVGLEDDPKTGRMVSRTGDSLMARPSTWLWRPNMLPVGSTATIEFSVPEGMEVSVPWPLQDQAARSDRRGPGAVYTLDSTAFHWLAYAVFGRLTVDRFERAGSQIELTTLDSPIACPPDGLRAWISDAVDTVALLFDGQFPRDRLQVVVIPVERGGGTVYFGMAGRGGGAGIFIFLDSDAQAEALPGGWTTIHEMLHHGMPFIDEPWMAEGWVSYYTELMRTRMGHRSEAEGWAALDGGFARGRRRVLANLEEASARMHENHQYQRVYWGGATVALLTDIQMRIESGGSRGLDDAMKELRRCCGDADHLWAAQELLEKLDDWYGRPLFTQTANTVLSMEQFPDTRAAFGRVGVAIEGDTARLDDESEHAALRRAIMAPRPTR